MAKYNIIIADGDKGYIDAISKYLISYGNKDFNITSFSQRAYLSKYLETDKGDILLISPEMIDPNINLDNIQVIIINIEDRIPENLIKYPYIHKYQPGDLIAKNIINIFSQQSKDEIIDTSNNQHSKVIGVFSPIGGIGKTTTSIVLGKQYARSNYKTLFISLEELSSYRELLDCTSTKDFSDMIYYIKQGNNNLLLKIEGLKNIDSYSELDYFSPPLCYEDIQEVSIDEWIYFIDYLRNNSSYERIILDFDSTLSKKNMKILQICDEVILLVNGDNMSKCKIETMYNNLNKMNMNDINNNIKIVYNNNNINKEDEIMEGVSIKGKDINLYLPYDNNLITYENSQGYIHLDNPFSEFIKKLIN
ncbi:MAG: AAA family ATPase [Vallitalea sp.]|jgi:cellulose biosynthesis protein BcsQ|nr:AAA family ATPase [Vallitalea sp.]